uniref:Uncharacterized protein n=1 Tax=Oryza punctata TaxID=4537 RepID=A0A0E0KH18_ORYPU
MVGGGVMRELVPGVAAWGVPPDSMPSLGVSSIGVSSMLLLNAVASHCQLPLVSYLWEMGSVVFFLLEWSLCL